MAPVRALEFYSGIGGVEAPAAAAAACIAEGMHYGLAAAVPGGADVVCAFDINLAANAVYEANCGSRPWQGSVQAIPTRILDDPSISLWLLAPPCQPYTRRGLQLGAADGRAGSFLSLLRRIPELKSPPAHLLVENVVGFEESSTADDLRTFLAQQGYAVQEFQLTPTQLGIPYSRPRYFCLARKVHSDGSGAFPVPSTPGRPLMQPPAALFASHAGKDVRRSAAAATPPVAAQRPASGDAEDAGTAAAVCALQNGSGAAVPADAAASGSTSSADNRQRPRVAQFIVADPAAEGVPPTVFGGIVNAKAAARQRHALNDAPGTPLASGTQPRPSDGTTALTSGTDAASCSRPTPADVALATAPNVAHAAPAGSTADADNQTAVSAAAPSAAHDPWAGYRFPNAELAARGIVLDIVSPSSTVVNCFTKTYGRYSKGSGSVLATECLETLPRLAAAFPQYTEAAVGSVGDCCEDVPEPASSAAEQAAAEAEEAAAALPPGAPVGEYVQLAPATEAAAALGLKAGEPLVPTPAPLLRHLQALRLRYFTPAEIAALHGFPPSFRFPPHVTLRQRYALLGNSLSVDVVAALLRYLLADGQAG